MTVYGPSDAKLEKGMKNRPRQTKRQATSELIQKARQKKKKKGNMIKKISEIQKNLNF